MTMKELVVCKFAGCNQVYNDARILPCGKRTCAAHIETMVMAKNDTDSRNMIKCHFCEEIHSFPDNGKGFPADECMPQLLTIRHSFDHDAAKDSFTKLTLMLEQLTALDEEHFAIDYFGRVNADVLLEKEVNEEKLAAYYQQLEDHVQEQQSKCLHALKTNQTVKSEFVAIKKATIEFKSVLKQDNVDFILKTLDGDEAKWEEIQSKCICLLNKTQSLGDRLKETIIGDQAVRFVSSSSNTQLEDICGHLDASHQGRPFALASIVRSSAATTSKRFHADCVSNCMTVLFWLFLYLLLGIQLLGEENRFVDTTIDSTILTSETMQSDIVRLFNLKGNEFKLIYRASRDGFEAASIRAKIGQQSRTLTIFKRTDGSIFGGFNAIALVIIWKDQPKSAYLNGFVFRIEDCRYSLELNQVDFRGLNPEVETKFPLVKSFQQIEVFQLN